MWGCALAACRALGRTRAILRIVYTAQNDRCDEHELDALDLAEFAGRLESVHVTIAALRAAKARGEVLDTREGSWCKWCPCKHVCPSKNALLAQVAEKGLAVLGDAAMTPERARAGYEQIVRLEDLVRDALRVPATLALLGDHLVNELELADRRAPNVYAAGAGVLSGARA
jgi:hypothetical protein